MKHILVVTDAWRPQVNGVVHTLGAVSNAARALGVTIDFLSPDGFASIPLPTYKEIRLALATPRAVAQRIDAIAPDHVHIATEGPLGFAARRVCMMRKAPFTTSYHTRFPEYIRARIGLPEGIAYAALRNFHNAAAGTMVATPRLEAELAARGFRHLMRWSRGVDHELFHPRDSILRHLPQPVFLYAGRLAVEKNIAAFLRLDLPGSKVVVGEGPARAELMQAFPQAHFLGLQTGEALAALYASADVFVFPSLTDTFGIVLLEAMASGVPVAAFPVQGPLDVIGNSGAGALDQDLRKAALAALDIPREQARAHALTFTWEASAQQFLDNVRAARSSTLQIASGKQPKLLGQRQIIQPR